jgi:pimeloyl-ACP methyl ester carboxylesterase
MPYIEFNESIFHYHVQGDGPVALFLHGFPFDASMWAEQMDDLAGLRRCIAIDLRGFGRSERSARPVLTLEDHADDLATFLTKTSVVAGVDLVGLSMGGYVALAFAQRYPDQVRSLALLDSRATADTAEALVVREGRSAFAATLIDALFAEEASPWLRARVRTMIEGTPAETIVAALEGMKQRPDRTQVMAHAQIPMAVIVGEHDRWVSVDDAQRMAESTGASFTVVPGAGHMTPIEQPGAVVSALRALWLKT